MSIKKENVQISIDVKTQQAVREVAKLQHEWQDLIPKVDTARKAVDKASTALEKFKITERNSSNQKWKDAYDHYYKQLTIYESLQKSADNYSIQIERQVKELGLAGLTNKELNRYYAIQKRALDGLRRGTEEYTEALQNLKKAQAEKTIRRDDLAGEKSIMDSLKGGLMPALIGGVAGGIVAMSGEILGSISSVVGNFVRAKAEQEKIYSALAAELGLDLRKNADDINYYKHAVSELGKEYHIAGSEIVDIIKNVGSLKPELLTQREALRDVTADVILLSKASNGLLTMEESAQAVTGALNQFGEEADQSGRYINVMAAGAKEGSSKIQQTAEAFKASGAVLKASNLTFEESNSLVQVLAKKMIVGSEAGTVLRNIFSKLLTGTEELNPAIHGINVVLDRLADKSPAEMMKLFGQESVVAAMEIVKAKKNVEDLTEKITGTNEATIAYEKLTNNLSGDLDGLATASDRFWNSLGQSSTGWLRNMTQGITGVIDKFTEFFKYSKFFGDGYIKMNEDNLKAKQFAENREMIKNQKEDVRLNTLAILPKQKGKDLNEKTLNANRKITEQVRTQFLDADKTYKDLVAKGAKADEILEADKERQRLAVKVKYAKTEGVRLQKVAQENAELIKKIKEGEDRLKQGKNKGDAQRLADELKKNEAHTLAEITKMKIEAISNETDQKESQLRQDFEDDKANQLKLVKEKKLTQESYEAWLRVRKETLNRELIKNDKDAEKKAREVATEVNLKAAKRRIEIEKEKLIAKLALANATEDKEAALSIEKSILLMDQELELLTATEDEKLSILEKYKIREQALKAKYDVDKAKSDKERSKKEKEDQKKSDDETLKKKKELYNKIGNFIGQTKDAIGEIFSFERQGIDNQINAEDKRYNKRLKQLDDQKEKGIISEDEYQTAITKLNEEHDAKERELKKKMFEADKKARIAQIVMTTAQAVMSALASIPPNPFLAVAAGITGALQLATALSTEMPAYADGDFTGNGKKYAGKKPTPSAELAWVNENGPEFIANNDAVNMPEFPIMLPLLRKLNKKQTIFPDLRSMFVPPKVAYANGDFTGPAEFARRKARNTASTPQNSTTSDDRLVNAIEEFNTHCRNGTWAKVMFSHKMADDFNDLLTENEDVRNRASAQ